VSAPALELALESSRREASLALTDGTRSVAAEVGPGAHASGLLVRLEELLEAFGPAARRRPLPLARIYVGLGPGSYTGLRVGLATAQALARASGAELFGLGSFEALAFEALRPGEIGAVVFDGRAACFYHARYRRTDDDLEELAPLAACAAPELRARLAHEGRVLAHAGLCEAAGLESLAARLEHEPRPRATGLLALARRRRAAGTLAPAAALEPLYLRAFGQRPGGGR